MLSAFLHVAADSARSVIMLIMVLVVEVGNQNATTADAITAIIISVMSILVALTVCMKSHKHVAQHGLEGASSLKAEENAPRQQAAPGALPS